MATPTVVPDGALRLVRTDFTAHRDALLARVRARWPGVWTDLTSNNVAMMLVDLMAYTTQTMAYTVNQAASEQTIPTMALRESAVRLGALTGYKLRGPVPASLLCEATISQPGGVPGNPYVRIAKGTTIRVGDDQLPFEVVRDYVIDGGQTTPVELVLTLDASLAGQKVLSTNVRATAGLDYLDAVDETVDLAAFISAGQSLRRVTGDQTLFTVVSVEAPHDGASNSRIYIAPAWQGSPGTVEITPVQVLERRIELAQGQTVVEQVTTPSDDSPNFSYKLRELAVDNSVSVMIGATAWRETAAISIEGPEDQVFEVVTLPSGVTVIVFGDGTFGAKVPTDSVIEVTYRTGGGSQGNVALNAVSTTITGTVISLSNPISVAITNTTSTGQGGRDAETVEEARASIPRYTKTNDRAVTLDDWQSLAARYAHPQHGSIAYARAFVDTANSFFEGNLVKVVAWTTGPANTLVKLSPALKTALASYLESKAVGTDYPVILDGTERPVPVSMRVKVLPGYAINDTLKLVNARLTALIVHLPPGGTLVYSDLVRALDEVTGVDSVELATPTSDLSAATPSEVFTPPQDAFLYSLKRNFKSAGTALVNGSQVQINTYVVQLPIWPLEAWSFKLYLGATELTVVTDTQPGYARVFGTVSNGVGIVDDDLNIFKSRIHLLTGQAEFTFVGSPGDLSLTLKGTHGYDRERTVDVFVGYSGTNTVEKRNEIRSALRTWSSGLGVGEAIFAQEVAGLAVSRSNVMDVVKSISGVNTVNRVALENPSNSENRASANPFELLRLGSIVINNQTT